MNKIIASVTKELLLLLNDKIGLFFMFFMPILLVFIITIIQNSAYEIINENKISLRIANHDNGNQGDSLITLLEESNMFDISFQNDFTKTELAQNILENNILTGIYIPHNFTQYINNKAANTTEMMLYQMGLNEAKPEQNILKLKLDLVYDPILQENYVKSIESILFQTVSILENTNFIKEIYDQIGVENKANDLKANILNNKLIIKTSHAQLSEQHRSKKPNATQHNVPAWTIFALFFMVVSLANNIVKEKNNGSFVRLKTMPSSIYISLIGKMLVFLFAAVLQVIIIFSIGIYIFPYLGLPQLNYEGNIMLFALVVLSISMAAISWAFFIGTYAKTAEQASGIGAISIIIFAAIGGIWVPTFAMPSFMQKLSTISPMNWSLEAFYTLLLRNGNIKELLFTFVYLFIFIIILQGLSIFKLKQDKLI